MESWWKPLRAVHRMARRQPKNYLRTLRLKSGLTQPELGLLLGVTKSAINKYENNTCRLPVERLIACEIIFGVGPAGLLIALRLKVEDALGRRALVLHNRIEGRRDAASLKKLMLLDGISERAQEVHYDL